MSGTRIWDGIENNCGNGAENKNSFQLIRRENRIQAVKKTANLMALDTSGSTEEALWDDDPRSKNFGIKEGANLFISKIPEGSWLSLIFFNEEIKVFPMQELNDRFTPLSLVQNCVPDGGTAMGAALKAACREALKVPQGYLIRVFLITDGIPTDEGYLEAAQSLKKMGAIIYCIGVGYSSGIDEELMKKLAAVSPNEGPLYRHFCSERLFTGFMISQTSTITY